MGAALYSAFMLPGLRNYCLIFQAAGCQHERYSVRHIRPDQTFTCPLRNRVAKSEANSHCRNRTRDHSPKSGIYPLCIFPGNIRSSMIARVSLRVEHHYTTLIDIACMNSSAFSSPHKQPRRLHRQRPIGELYQNCLTCIRVTQVAPPRVHRIVTYSFFG